MKEQTDKIINKNFKKVEKKIENHASELERNNKIAMYSHLVEVIIITLFCILEAATRGKSWLFVNSCNNRLCACHMRIHSMGKKP